MASRSNPANGVPWQKPFTYKLVLLGETAVGKSSLVMRFVKGEFKEFRESTIGAAFLTSTVCPDGKTIKFEIWDTAGQERFHTLAPMYYRGAQAALILYDITSQDSFRRAQAWVDELRKQASPNILMMMVGNKADLANRTVSMEEAQIYARDHNALFMEASAKTGMNVNEIFQLTARALANKEQEGTVAEQRRRGVNLSRQNPDSPDGEVEGRKSCCS